VVQRVELGGEAGLLGDEDLAPLLVLEVDLPAPLRREVLRIRARPEGLEERPHEPARVGRVAALAETEDLPRGALEADLLAMVPLVGTDEVAGPTTLEAGVGLLEELGGRDLAERGRVAMRRRPEGVTPRGRYDGASGTGLR